MKYKLKTPKITELPKWKISSYENHYENGVIVKNGINYISDNGQKLTVSGVNGTMVYPCVMGA